MHFGQVNYINFREAPETEASLLFEKREQDRTNENKAFFSFWKKVNSEIFLHIWNPESQAGTNEKEERENQRERQSRGTACHRWRFGASAMAMACQSNAYWLSKFSWNWLIEMWDYVMLMCLSNAQWPSGHSPLIGPLCEKFKQSGVSAKCIIMALIYFPGIDSTRFEIL